MGYDLHVLRGDDWSESADHPIPTSAWEALVARSDDLEAAGAVEATTPDGGVIRYENPGLAEWTGHPDGGRVPFDHRSGRIVVKDPDPAVIAKLIEVAQALDARVQGDEGEFYDAAP